MKFLDLGDMKAKKDLVTRFQQVILNTKCLRWFYAFIQIHFIRISLLTFWEHFLLLLALGGAQAKYKRFTTFTRREKKNRFLKTCPRGFCVHLKKFWIENVFFTLLNIWIYERAWNKFMKNHSLRNLKTLWKELKFMKERKITNKVSSCHKCR